MMRFGAPVRVAALALFLAAYCGVSQGTALARFGMASGAAVPFCSRPSIGAEEGSPAVGARLGIEKNVLKPGEVVRVRIEDFGSSDLTYGFSYELARRSRRSWVKLPHGPVFGSRLYVQAGTASECQSIQISRRAIAGRYRIAKKVRPVGQAKDVVVRATFFVRR